MNYRLIGSFLVGISSYGPNGYKLCIFLSKRKQVNTHSSQKNYLMDDKNKYYPEDLETSDVETGIRDSQEATNDFCKQTEKC